jgi:hypothetical protein
MYIVNGNCFKCVHTPLESNKFSHVVYKNDIESNCWQAEEREPYEQNFPLGPAIILMIFCWK